MLAFHPLFARDPLLDLLGPAHRQACAPLFGIAPLARRVTASLDETDEAFVLTIQAPGVKSEDLRISYEDDILIVDADTEAEHGRLSFKRQAKCPNADPTTAEAKHENGVLTVTLKKLPPREAVYIKVGDAQIPDGAQDDENDAPYTLTVAAPGVKPSDILIEASRTTLSIHGETSRGQSSFSIHRTYKLPTNVNVSAAIATHVDGLLSVRLPTRPAEAATTITIHKAEKEAEAEAEAETKELSTKTVEEEVKENSWLAEFDTLLEDLAEMGFEDGESNRAALAKHSGSIKLAIKELVMNRRA